jgi:hypothetical protein
VPYADPVLQKEHMRRMAQNRQDAQRAYVKALKEANPCSDCGQFFPYVCMDFDHKDPSTKRLEISRCLSRTGSWRILIAELEKCVLVCSNCHRIREAERRGEEITVGSSHT